MSLKDTLKSIGFKRLLIMTSIIVLVGFTPLIYSISTFGSVFHPVDFLLSFIVIAMIVIPLIYTLYSYIDKMYLDPPYLFIEEIIPLKKEIYVLGTAVPSKKAPKDSTHNAILTRTDNNDTLTVSDRSEKSLIADKEALRNLVLGGLGILGSLSAFVFLIWTGTIFEIDNPEGIGSLALLLFISAASFYGSFKGIKRKEKIKSVPTSDIESLSMGLVEVKGTTRPVEKSLIAPFTGTKCVGYRCEIKRFTGEKYDKWETIQRSKTLPIFYLEDQTGRIPVDPNKAYFKLSSVFKEKIKELEELPEAGRKFLKGSKIESNLKKR